LDSFGRITIRVEILCAQNLKSQMQDIALEARSCPL